jgi:hypothetical protein
VADSEPSVGAPVSAYRGVAPLGDLDDSDGIPPSMPGELVVLEDPIDPLEGPASPMAAAAPRASVLGDPVATELSPESLRALASDPVPSNGAAPAPMLSGPELVDGLVVPPPAADRVIIEEKKGVQVSLGFLVIFALLLVGLGAMLGLVLSGTI